MPTGYLLGFHTSLGPVGVWAGLSLGLAVVGVLLAFRVRRLVWRGAQDRVPSPSELGAEAA